MLPPQSESLKSVGEGDIGMSQQTVGGNNVIHPRPDSSFNGQSGTFAPRLANLKDSQGPACTISQVSNQIELNKEIGPSASECDETKPQQLLGHKNANMVQQIDEITNAAV